MTNTRSDILSAARECFLLYGFRRCSMDDIAQAAGVSRPAIYQYFPNKEGIFSTLLDMVIEEAFEAAEQSIEGASGRSETLERYMLGYIRYYYKLVMAGPHSDELFVQKKTFGVEKTDAARKRFMQRLNALMGLDDKDEMGLVLSRAAEGIKLQAKTEDELVRQLRILIGLATQHLDAQAKSNGSKKN